MVKKLRNLAYTYAVFSSVIIAFLFYFLMKGVSAVFDILPDLLVIDYIEELFSIIYPIGIVILFGFSSKLKSKAPSKVTLYILFSLGQQNHIV